jgi:hypothetical protein
MISDILFNVSGSMPFAALRYRRFPPPEGRAEKSGRNEAQGTATTAVSECMKARSRSAVARTPRGIGTPRNGAVRKRVSSRRAPRGPAQEQDVVARARVDQRRAPERRRAPRPSSAAELSLFPVRRWVLDMPEDDGAAAHTTASGNERAAAGKEGR